MEFKWTEDTTSQTYKDSLSIRKTVFIDEQQVPVEEEIDNLEESTLHVVGYLGDDPCVTARIYEAKSNTYKIQRVAVLKTFRKQGAGLKLMEEVETYTKRLGAEYLTLGSQDHAIPFYEKAGFTVQGKGFMDAGIPHHTMTKPIKN